MTNKKTTIEVVIRGPQGAGKSTMAAALGGVLEAYGAKVTGNEFLPDCEAGQYRYKENEKKILGRLNVRIVTEQTKVTK